uniref:Uncharacterized protein n=1 Tax=Anguilla anguilla TaxID=7936 RepID=A0A0E9UPN3_ANGAN
MSFLKRPFLGVLSLVSLYCENIVVFRDLSL